MKRAFDLKRILPRERRWRLVVAVAIVGLIAAVLPFAGGRSTKGIEPQFAVSPQGDDVARLAPVKVSFKAPPAERDGAKLLMIEPRVEGEYAWIGDRTLLFQPNFPGLLRGWQYTVNVAAAPEAGLERAYVRQFTTAGALSVQTVIPAPDDAEVPKGAQVLVQFSRSVAPLTTLAERSTKPVIEFDPPLPGKGEWLNTSLYRFIPDAVPGVTKFRARIAAGLTSAADGVLKQDFVWSFTTFSPALESVSPEDQTTFASLRQKIVLRFNQAMDKGSVAQAVRVARPDGGAVAGSFAWTEKDTVATFTPGAPLTRGTRYQIAVPAGLRNATGGLSQVGRTSSFTTIGEPGIAGTHPVAGSTNADRYGISITFTNPMNTKSLDGKIGVSGVDSDKLNPDWYADDRTLFLNTRLRPSTKYTVSVGAGATDREGQQLAPYSFSFTTGALQPFVSLAVPSQVATYSASVEPILYFHASNVTQASFSLYPLTPAERSLILSENHVPYLANTVWTPSSAPIRTWVQPVTGPRDEILIGSTSLTGSGALPKGDYFVRSGSGGYASDLAFSVVDTAIVAKLSHDELLAWVLDLDSGRTLGGVRVNASGPGLAASAALTDGSGLAWFALPNLALATDPAQISRTYVLTVDDGGHRGIASTSWSQGAQPWQLGIPTEYYPSPLVGHVYTDRPIYRPGEEVFYKGVVRADDDVSYSVPQRDIPMNVTVGDAQGKQLASDKITLNDFGTFASSFRLPDTAAIGDYYISLQLDRGQKSQRNFAGVSFAVAEFRKPEFQVDVAADRDRFVSGERIPANATATYFFGGALEGAAMAWSVQSSPYFLSVKGYERYSFSDYDYYVRPSVSRDAVRARGKAVTGADGRAAFSVPAVVEGGEGAQQYTIAATVTDQNAQAVSASTSVTVHPADCYAGIRPAAYLAEAGTDARIDLVTVDTAGKVLAGKPVVVKVYERTWVTTKEQSVEGGRRYRSEPVDTLLVTLAATTNERGEGAVTYRPAKSGSLRLVAEVLDGRGRASRSAAYLWVAGAGYASWRVTNDDTFQLVADKEKYEVGDTAEILVPAPFQGAVGLVTVERGKVITRASQAFPTNAERLRIPVVDRDVPDVFVSVVLYRPPTSEDPIPRYKVGYVELPVSTRTRALAVSIQPDRQQAKPGDTVRYDIRVTDSAGRGVKAELSVAVVDKAVLSLADERGTTGLKAFWFERGLGVTTSSSLAVSINRSNDVIADVQTLGKGGGGGNERLRQDFRNTTFWQAQLVTKDDGTATVQVPMPDNLTTWRMQARAVSGGTLVGEGANELLSTQPLLLRPALPRFLRVGDRATIRLLVRNGTQKESDVNVALAVEGIDVSGATARSGKVAPNASTLFEWPATVSTSGAAKLTFRAAGSGGLSDAVEQQIPIALDVTPETTATGGVVISDPLSEAIYLPAYAIRSNGGLQVRVQPSLTGSMSAELAEFARRSWETYEDTVKVASRAIATIGVRRADRGAGAPAQTLDGQVQTDLATIVGRQNPDGGWSWCSPSYCPSDPEVTGWVLIALGEARREGRTVEPSTLDGASTWVSRYLNRLTDVESPADVNQKAFLLYALAASGRPDTYVSQIRAMVEQYRAKLANFGRAYLLLGLAEADQPKSDSYVSRLLNDLATGVLPSANGNHWEDEYYRGSTHTNTRTTGLVLDALVRADSTHPLIEETVRWLMVARGAGQWETYLERAQAMLALSEFAAKTGELAGDYAYSVRLDERDVLAGQFKPGDGRKTDDRTVPLAQIDAGKVSLLNFSKQARAGRMYYSLNLRYVTPAKEVEALNRGIAVTHEYTLLAEPNRRVDRVKLGDTVRVKMTVVVPADQNYVQVDDFLPAGLEPVDPRLKTTDPNLRAQLERERQGLSRPGGVDYWAPWFHWYYSPWEQSEIRDDHVTLKAQRLPKGVHEFVYYARATTPGDYFVAPAHAEDSFFPDVFGRSDSGRFVIEP